MVVRNSTTLMSARRAALLIALCLQLFSLVRPARGTARRTTYFEDTACGVEVFGEYVFSARAIDSQGNVSEGRTASVRHDLRPINLSCLCAAAVALVFVHACRDISVGSYLCSILLDILQDFLAVGVF